MSVRGKVTDKHGRTSRSNTGSVMVRKTDTPHMQRRAPEEESESEEEEETKWYEEGETEFTTQAIKELDAKVTMAVVPGGGMGRGAPAAAAPKKKQKKKRKDSPTRGLPSKDAHTKFLGKKWNPVPNSYKRGALSGRKGDMASELHSPYGLYAQDETGYSIDTETSDLSERSKIRHPCKFYMVQRCKKGAACPFLHDDHAILSSYGGSQEPPPSGVCLDWYYYGSCANGDHCGLAHYIDGDFYDEEEEEEVVEPRRVCPMWLQGKCKAGGNCKFQHMSTTKETDVSVELSMVSQGAGRIATTVASRIQKLRDSVLNLKNSLQYSEQHLLTRTLQMVLGRLESDDREMLLGLQKDIVGLTRFRSVLVKRLLKWSYDSLNLEAIESLSQWEAAMSGFVPKPPKDGTFSKYFEQHLCNTYMDIIRSQMASPYTRIRQEWVDQAITHSTSPDPLHDILSKWLPFQNPSQSPLTYTDNGFLLNGVKWSFQDHVAWPLPHRRRIRGFVHALRKRNRRWMTSQPTSGPSLLTRVASYLPPVCESDIPKAERVPGTHPALDALIAILVDYEINVLNTTEGARDKMGETVWPLVSSCLGGDVAPKITGMLLQLDPTQLLLVAVNTDRFRAALDEAMEVLQEQSEDCGGGDEPAGE